MPTTSPRATSSSAIRWWPSRPPTSQQGTSMSQRTDRLDSQIRQELMELLQREMKDPRVGFATITRVETARDLGSAKVWVSILGSQDERDQTLKALTDAAPWLRRQLGGRRTIRQD